VPDRLAAACPPARLLFLLVFSLVFEELLQFLDQYVAAGKLAAYRPCRRLFLRQGVRPPF
jgi:hypothetical protein